MSDTIDGFRDLKELRRVQRLVFGVPCPVCRKKLPKAHPKILEPGRLCRAHKPFYRDPRPEPTAEEFNEKMAAHGWHQEVKSQAEIELGISGYHEDGSPY